MPLKIPFWQVVTYMPTNVKEPTYEVVKSAILNGKIITHLDPIYTALQCTFYVMLLKFSWKRPRFSEKPVLIVDRNYQCKACIENIAYIAQFQYTSVGKLGIMLTFSRCLYGRIWAILIFSCYIFTFHSLFPKFIYFFSSV